MITSFCTSHLNLPSEGYSLSNFMGLGTPTLEGENVVRLIGLYAAYSSHNKLRYDDTLDPSILLRKFAQEAVIGHASSQKWLAFFRSGFRSENPSLSVRNRVRRPRDEDEAIPRSVRSRGANVAPPSSFSRHPGVPHSSSLDNVVLGAHFINDGV